MHTSPAAPDVSTPRLFGSRVVVGAWVAQLFAMGATIGAYPVFIDAIETEFGTSRAQSAMGIPLLMLAAALLAPLIGKWVDRGSPRHIMALGGLMMGSGYWLLGYADSLLVLTLGWVFLVGMGQAMLGVLPANTVLANWFEQRRAMMVAIAGTGITVGFATFPFVAELLVSQGGFRTTLKTFSLLCVLIPTPIVLYCMLKSPAAMGLNVDGKPDSDKQEGDSEAVAVISFFSDPRFWLAGLSLACMPASLMSFNTHLVGWSEDLQFGRSFGVTLLSTAAVVVAISSLLFGQICDRLGAINTLRIALLVEMLGFSIMLASASQVTFVMGLALFALGAGSFIPCHASLLSSLWPVGAFGRASGYIGLLIIAGIFVLPPAVGWGYERFEGYSVPMSWTLAVLITALILLTFLQAHLSRMSSS
ncbi:MAG: MFS transporter [Halioglobus sp.]